MARISRAAVLTPAPPVPAAVPGPVRNAGRRRRAAAVEVAPPPAGARDAWLIAAVVGLVATTLGVWRSVFIGQSVGDALSRTFSALSVLHAHDAQLASIGFIWPPLPALAQLPILALAPRAAYYGLSGNLVTAASGALAAAFALRLFRHVGIGRWVSLLLVLALFTNPLMWFYSANGMSEMPFVAAFILACDAYLTWAATGHWRSLIVAGFACAAMLLCRYDAIVVTAALAGAVVLVMWAMRAGGTWEGATVRPRLESQLIAFLAPVGHVVLLWFYFNWTIMGDPLYFWHSEYSNLYLTREVRALAEVQEMQRSLLATGGYFIRTVGGLSPLFLAATVLGVGRALWKRDAALLGLIAVLLAAPAFQLWSYRSGSTFGFVRFYVSVIPAGLVLAAYLYATMRRVPWRLKLGVILVLVALSNLASMATMSRTGQTPLDEHGPLLLAVRQPLTPQRERLDEERAAAYLNERVSERSILIDELGRDVALFSGRPALYYLPSDTDWRRVIASPAQAPVRYVVSVERETPEYHAFRELYPHMRERGLPFATLEATFGTVRIYRVNGK
jgi:hypothetical protein